MKTVRQLASDFLRKGLHNICTGPDRCEKSVRAFAVYAKQNTPAPTVLNPSPDCQVEANENFGKVEVIVHWQGKRCRLLCDKDGIHKGSVVDD